MLSGEAGDIFEYFKQKRFSREDSMHERPFGRCLWLPGSTLSNGYLRGTCFRCCDLEDFVLKIPGAGSSEVVICRAKGNIQIPASGSLDSVGPPLFTVQKLVQLLVVRLEKGL